jgi:hypothetical protein
MPAFTTVARLFSDQIFSRLAARGLTCTRCSMARGVVALWARGLGAMPHRVCRPFSDKLMLTLVHRVERTLLTASASFLSIPVP